MMRKCPWLIFALVFAWKIALFLFSVQPVPANDAFFYDGAVVHYLQLGGYYNASLAHALPISGTQLFSAYPPLYQLPLIGWMSLFGVSARSAMALHLLLFGLFLLVLLAIFRRLQTPAWCVNIAGGFLLALTFHDRPDSLAQLLGICALYACVRSRRLLDQSAQTHQGLWTWLMVLLVALTFCASLQIGGTYLLVVMLATVIACRIGKERVPIIPLAMMASSPVLIALLVKLTMPGAWAGFIEHLKETPSLTGLRTPHWQEMLKIIRTIPGIFVVMVMLPVSWFKQHRDFGSPMGVRHEILLLAALLPAAGILVACLSVATPNWVGINGYLQVLIVAVYLGLCVGLQTGARWMRFQVLCLLPAIALSSVRAVGMTTWGAACAADVSYSAAMQRVEQELAACPPQSKVVLSSAFLYGAYGHKELELIHSDWLTRAGGDSLVSDSRGLVALKPVKIILTQYDYYRRYQNVLEHMKNDSALKEIQITNLAHTPTPDSIPSLQRVVQHISWAPVIVNLTWQ